MGVCNYHQSLQASDGSDGDQFGLSVEIYEQNMFIGEPYKNNSGDMYEFTLQGKTWTYHKNVTASAGTADDDFGRSFAISGDTLLVGDRVKYDYIGRAYIHLSLQETDCGIKERCLLQ